MTRSEVEWLKKIFGNNLEWWDDTRPAECTLHHFTRAEVDRLKLVFGNNLVGWDRPPPAKP